MTTSYWGLALSAGMMGMSGSSTWRLLVDGLDYGGVIASVQRVNRML
jgi:hypothetical protein